MSPVDKKWRGPCPNCRGLWSIRRLRAPSTDHPNARRAAPVDGEMVPLCDVTDDAPDVQRIEIGGRLSAIDELLGGEHPGIVPGSLILLAGPPGVGKSTLILQISQRLATRMDVAYITNEESTVQVGYRAKRLGRFSRRLLVLRAGDLEEILDKVEEQRPKVVIIDSAQTLIVTNNKGDELETGSPMAIKNAMLRITEHAKRDGLRGTTFIIIGHITHDGSIAGGKSGLEHAVDAVLYFDGDPDRVERTLAIPSKNRFGPTGKQARTVHMLMKQRGLVVVEEDELAEMSAAAKEEEEHAKNEGEKRAKNASAALSTSVDKPSSHKRPALRAVPLDDETSAAWVAADGTTAAAVLRVPCPTPGCDAPIDRACTAASGVREAGFHQARVLASNIKRVLDVAAEVEVIEPVTEADPFAPKRLGSPPRVTTPRRGRPPRKRAQEDKPPTA